MASCRERRPSITRRADDPRERACVSACTRAVLALPKTEALLRQEHILALVKAALGEAKITPAQLDCIAYTKVKTKDSKNFSGFIMQVLVDQALRSTFR